MATMTISLPDQMKDWIESRIRQGDYSSASDYVRDLVRRDRRRRAEATLNIEDLRQLIEESRASGPGDRSLQDLLADAKREAEAHGLLRE